MMDSMQVQRIIDRILKLWPEWSPNSDEIDEWKKRLYRFPSDVAAEAVSRLYGETNTRKPSLAKLALKMGVLYQGSKIPGRDRPEPALAYRIRSVENPRNEQAFYLRKLPDPIPSEDAFMWEAQRKREEFEQMYDGTWTVIRDWVDIGIEKPEDILVGEPAKKLAYERILAGPDTAGRRWLIRYLDSKSGPEETKEPQLVSNVIEDDIPF